MPEASPACRVFVQEAATEVAAMSASGVSGEERLSILTILGKLLEHHVRCEGLQHEETAERSRQYHGMDHRYDEPQPLDNGRIEVMPHVQLDTMRAEVERAVEGTTEFRKKLGQLKHDLQAQLNLPEDQRDWPQIEESPGQTRDASEEEAEGIVVEEARRWAVGRLLDERMRERYGEEGLQPPLAVTPWQTAFQLLLGKHGLGSVLTLGQDPCDGELRNYVARWRLAIRGPIPLPISPERQCRVQFHELRPGEKIQAWADKMDESGRTGEFLAEIIEAYPEEAADLKLGESNDAGQTHVAGSELEKPLADTVTETQETKTGQQIEWSKPVFYKDLKADISVSHNTLKGMLVEGTGPVPGKIRYQKAKPTARKIQVAIADLPAKTQAKYRPNS